MKNIKLSAVLLMVAAFFMIMPCARANAAETAQSVLAKASAKVTGTKGMSCAFTLSASGRSVKGTLKSSGKKFALITPVSSSWFDGRNMWTYNPSSAETTLVNPTADEIAETNPLTYISLWKSSYDARFSNSKIKGKYVVELTPKRRHSAVKKVVITFNRNYIPEKISVTGSNNAVTTVAVSSVNYNAAVKASDFVYPKSRYPKAEIIDLR